MSARVVVLDRAAHGAGLRGALDRRGRVLGGGPVAILEIHGDGRPVARVSERTCSATSSSVACPSLRPRVKAKPELVVASALNPSASSTRAEPASHGFGMRKASPSCSARNSFAFCS
jgi:hypothetical protein